MADTNGNFPVLIVEDHPKMTKLLELLARRLGFTNVSTAADGSEALRHIVKIPVELILCDYNMRPMNGLDLRKELQSNPETVGIPFILVTASTEISLIAEAAKIGIDVLVKPFGFEPPQMKISSLMGADTMAQLA